MLCFVVGARIVILLFRHGYAAATLKMENVTTGWQYSAAMQTSSLFKLPRFLLVKGQKSISPQNAVKKRLGNGQQPRYRVWCWQRGWQGRDYRHLQIGDGEVLRLQRTTEGSELIPSHCAF